MKLYGTVTSPFVRRVRIIAAELGLPYTFIDVASDAGQATLRSVTPLWKVPVADLDGQIVFDSHVIIDRLLAQHGLGPLRPVAPEARWREANLLSVIDGALDSCINVFYLRREGLDVSTVPYLVKQQERTRSALAWVEKELRGAYFTEDARVGMSELALLTALDWMAFRGTFPVEDSPVLSAFRAAHASRPSFASTRPT